MKFHFKRETIYVYVNARFLTLAKEIFKYYIEMYQGTHVFSFIQK